MAQGRGRAGRGRSGRERGPHSEDCEEEAGDGGEEPDEVEEREVRGLSDEEGSDELAEDQAERVGHPQDQGGDGPLALPEPVLADLGGDAGDEGAAHASESLAEDGDDEGVVSAPPELTSPDPRESGEATQASTHCRQPGADSEAQPQSSPLHYVDRQETEGDTEPVGDHGDQVHHRPRHLVVLRPLLGHRGEADPVTVVGEVEESDGGQEDPAGPVQAVTLLFLLP